MSTDIGAHLLGRKVEHDPASKKYLAPMRRAAKPRNVTHANNAPILDQGELGSCVGNTAAEWLNCVVASQNRAQGMMATRYKNRNRYLTEIQAVELYQVATGLDEDTSVAYPPTDCGTSGLGVAKAMQAMGFIDGYDWTFTFAHFLSTLQMQPLCVGINWYSGMYDPDQHGLIRPTGSLEGGHEILARGVSFTSQLIRFRNHWGEDWGAHGEFFMTFADTERLLITEQGDAMAPRVK